MLLRAIALAPPRRRLHSFAALRSQAANDKLSQLLGTSGDMASSASAWSGAAPFPEDDLALANPPIGPIGSYPRPPPRPASRTQVATASHDLPANRHFHLHVFASRNNTILTLSRENHTPLAWVSAGVCGFRKVQRSGYEAGYQCAVRMFDKIAKQREVAPLSPFRLDIAFNGFGFGREAVFRALMASEGDKIRDTVGELKDVTRLKVGGGTKARKTRRL